MSVIVPVLIPGAFIKNILISLKSQDMSVRITDRDGLHYNRLTLYWYVHSNFTLKLTLNRISLTGQCQIFCQRKPNDMINKFAPHDSRINSIA